jgi:ABC-type transport system involved in cytochrome c biogenesis permease subunit
MPLAEVAIGSWFVASGAYAFKGRKTGDAFMMLGILCGAFILGSLWVSLGRPPLRTLGETRWWYAVLVPTLGLLIGWRFDTRALAIPACLMGGSFALINLQHPEYMDKTLMPALQSPWFVPHVTVYMLAYSALGLSSLIALWVLVKRRGKVTADDTDLPHRLVLVGLPLHTCGLLFGAFWAKEAWGHYWTWDPKETWAFLTWGAYLVYLHVKTRYAVKPALNLTLLVVGFGVLLACWFGVNLMPISKQSVHTYTKTE